MNGCTASYLNLQPPPPPPGQVYTVGGTVIGLSGMVVLQNNGGDALTVTADGSFTFSTALSDGAAYFVSVATQPTDQTCSVSSGRGVISAANVTSVRVVCSENAYTVGGVISGLDGTVVLQSNDADDLTLTSNGVFTFPLPVAEGSPYFVTVLTQPASQTCVIANGSGMMGSGDVTSVSVTCTNNFTTLSLSTSQLALSASGASRVIRVINTDLHVATGLHISYPTWPSGTTASSNCGSTLQGFASCAITITPGSSSTSDCSTHYDTPVPGIITVSADQASSLQASVVVLGDGCVYQQGFVFGIDDTTPTTGSIGGTALALQNLSDAQWYNGSFMATGADDLVDGAENTNTIITAQSVGGYAASDCVSYSIDSAGNSPCATGTCYTDWYLPAVCQLSVVGGGASCTVGTDNVYDDLPLLVGCVDAECVDGVYWSSTELAISPSMFAWRVDFNSGGQANANKAFSFHVRCARSLVP